MPRPKGIIYKKGDLMPNWVQNTVKIKSQNPVEIESIKTFLANEESPFSFSKVLPMPEEETDWYNWNISNWGTKWDASNAQLDTSSSSTILVYHYDTAWSPALPVLVKLSATFPNTSIFTRFIEEQGWGGEVEIVNGVTSIIKEWDIPQSHKEQVNLLGYCFCSDDRQVFNDCFSERASTEKDISARSKETVDAIAPEWEGSYTGLVDIAKIL